MRDEDKRYDEEAVGAALVADQALKQGERIAELEAALREALDR